MKTRRNNNEGSLFQVKNGAKAGFWVAKVCIGYNDKGKPIITQVQRREKADAQKALRDMLADLNKGTLIKTQDVLFYDWLESYMRTYAKQKVRQSTYQNQLDMLKYVKESPYLCNIKLQKVTTHSLQLFLGGIRLKNGAIPSASTLRNVMCVISKAMNQAAKNEYIKHNYASAVVLPSPKQKEKRALNKDELSLLLDAAKEHRLYYALLLLVSSGIRRGELLGLKWSDIDFEESTLSIARSYSRIAGKPFIGLPKTKSSIRTIALPPAVLSMLKSAYDSSDKAVEWVVPSAYTKSGDESSLSPMSPDNFRRLFISWCSKAGISNFSVHNTRHTFTSILVSDLHVDIKLLQEALGHSNAKTTIAVYAHYDKRKSHVVANAFNAILKEVKN